MVNFTEIIIEPLLIFHQIKSEARYQNGKPIGKFMIWDENGKKSSESIYYDAKPIKRIERDENGKIRKQDDHLLDALRYIINTEKAQTRPRDPSWKPKVIKSM